MTQLLEQVLSEVRKLSESEQDAIASLILDEIAEEAHWQESFAGSHALLKEMAEKAREDIRAGRVRDVGIDEL